MTPEKIEALLQAHTPPAVDVLDAEGNLPADFVPHQSPSIGMPLAPGQQPDHDAQGDPLPHLTAPPIFGTPAGRRAQHPLVLPYYDRQVRLEHRRKIMTRIVERFGGVASAPAAQVRAILGQLDPSTGLYCTDEGSTQCH